VAEKTLAAIQSQLRELREKRVITDREFWDFQKRLWKPKTDRELEEMAKELAELVRIRKETKTT
jgi:hypothetical protein